MRSVGRSESAEDLWSFIAQVVTRLNVPQRS